MVTKRQQIIEDYFKIMEQLRRLNVGPFKFWHQKGDVTRTQLGVLLLIHRHHLDTAKSLAQHLGISPSATTQILDGLVAAKLLNRTPDVQDRRKVVLSLTRQGHSLLKKMQRGMHQSVAAMFKPLSDGELRQLVKLQQKILNHFQSTHESEA